MTEMSRHCSISASFFYCFSEAIGHLQAYKVLLREPEGTVIPVFIYFVDQLQTLGHGRNV